MRPTLTMTTSASGGALDLMVQAPWSAKYDGKLISALYCVGKSDISLLDADRPKEPGFSDLPIDTFC